MSVNYEKVREYMNKVYETVVQRNPGEAEFHQAVKMFFNSIKNVLIKEPHYIEAGILERIVEPERYITFQVPWVDDEGKVRVNRGHRVQFNSAIGPYKGGIRFHPTVNSSVINFLGFQQTIKNALTGLSIGGGKGVAVLIRKGNLMEKLCAFVKVI